MMQRIKLLLDRSIAILSITLLSIMTLLISWQVAVRYLFNKPSAISEQSAQYLFVWLVFYGAAYVFGQREHMKITFIQDRFSPSISRYLDILQELLIGGFVLLVMVIGGSIAVSNQMTQKDAALQIPMGIIYSAIPISGVFTIFYTVYNLTQLSHKTSEVS